MREVWTPVTELALKCGYTLHLQAQALLVKVPFIACGVRIEVHVQYYALEDVHMQYSQYYNLVEVHVKYSVGLHTSPF